MLLVNSKQLNMLQNSGLPLYPKSEKNFLTVVVVVSLELHSRVNHWRSSGNAAANSCTEICPVPPNLPTPARCMETKRIARAV